MRAASNSTGLPYAPQVCKTSELGDVGSLASCFWWLTLGL